MPLPVVEKIKNVVVTGAVILAVSQSVLIVGVTLILWKVW